MKITVHGQLPEPDWATELADGKPAKAVALKARLVEWEACVGGQDVGVRAEMKAIVGRALLRRVERNNPCWDGKTRILSSGDVLAPGGKNR